MDSSDDQQVIRAVMNGNVNAYSILVQQYQKPIFNLMYRVTGSYEDAKDLAQETFIKAYEKLDHFRIGERFFPWLYTIGYNHARNFVQRGKPLKQSSDDDVEKNSGLDYPSQHEERALAQIDFMRIYQALGQLPADYREAVILHYHEGLSMEEIAAALELSISGAKMRVHRGIKKLREVVLGDNHEAEKTALADR
jgi:RNA polymerase sigma-70 factor (ECF subfamily)